MGRAERALRAKGGNEGKPLEWIGLLDEPVAKLQGTWGRELSEARRDSLLRSLLGPDAAKVRSHGGPGAGSFLLPSSQGGTEMPDQHFNVSLRDRLLLPVCEEGAQCQHRYPDGSVCNAPLDPRGGHARKCGVGGGVGRRHDRLCNFGSTSWSCCTGLPAVREQRVPQWDREVIVDSGRTLLEQAVLDVVTSDPTSGQPLYLDYTVTTACPDDLAALRRRARHDGRGASDAAAGKRRRYNLAGTSLVPLAFEDGGRPAEDTIGFVRLCGAAAEARGARWPLTEVEEGKPVTARLWQEYSTLLQLGKAELVLSANGR